MPMFHLEMFTFNSSVELKLTFLARSTNNIENNLKYCEISKNDELLPNLLKNPAYNQKYRYILIADK